MKDSITEALVVLGVALFCALAVNGFRADGIRLDASTARQTAEASDPFIQPPEIAMADAIAYFKNAQALFVDARHASAYEEGHIAGAINLEVARFEEWIDAFLSQTPPEKVIIAYCDGINCSLARELAEQLRLIGFEHAYYLKNGWQQWTANRLPIDAKDPSV